MSRIRRKIAPVSNTGNIRLGISLPAETLEALDVWATAAGYKKYDGSINRSGAFRALVSMWLAGDNYLAAAIKAKNTGLVGAVGDTARRAYQEAHEKVCAEIEKIEV
jgi:metal-responsive CopG/Arc/MetJ family transcriptional regulator